MVFAVLLRIKAGRCRAYFLDNKTLVDLSYGEDFFGAPGSFLPSHHGIPIVCLFVKVPSTPCPGTTTLGEVDKVTFWRYLTRTEAGEIMIKLADDALGPF